MKESFRMEPTTTARIRRTGTYEVSTSSGEPVHAFVPTALPPKEPELVRESYDQRNRAAELALARLAGVSAMIPSVDWLLDSAIRREALLTSQIEGTQATLVDLLDAEAGYATNNADDVEEVTNYIRAFRLIQDQLRHPAGLPLVTRLLCEGHAKLLAGVRGLEKQPGEIRRSQNWIGGPRPSQAVFVPPPPDRVRELLSDLELFIHSDTVDLPPLVKIALVHAQFETIRPFLDGNGRMGRLLITVLLQHWKSLDDPILYVSGHLKRNQSEYYRLLLAVRTHGDWEAWIAFFLTAIEEGANEAERSVVAIASLIAEDRKRLFHSPKAGATSYRLFELLPTMPRFSIEDASHALQTTLPTATAAIRTLQDAQIVVETTGLKKNRKFAYSRYIEALAQ